MNIVAFGASSSRSSINRQFARHAASFFTQAQITLLDLNDFDMPIFSVDLEREIGHPPQAKAFVDQLSQADLLIISLAEHNGSYTAAFKNIFDWASRYRLKMFDAAPMVVLSTATGPGGGKRVMENALNRFPKHGSTIIGQFSLPEFNENFDPSEGITHPELRQEFETMMGKVNRYLSDGVKQG